LAWLAENRVLTTKFDALATALWSLLQARITTPDDAREVWIATPAVLSCCNEQSTYQMAGAPVAYAWLHLLDRYARTWAALEKLVAYNCLPLAKFGVRTLDVGTGPGPSAFAIHDFYAALTQFGSHTGIEELKQPPQIACVEFDQGTNSLRHHLAELVSGQSGNESRGLLSLGFAKPDFSTLFPRQERISLEHHLRWKEEEYYDEETKSWEGSLIYSADEANHIAQSLHRYRLIVFSNFLTTVGTVANFEANLADILDDAQAGSVVMVLGGRGRPYPTIYERVDHLAKTAGFQLTMKEEEVSSADTDVAERVFTEGAKVYALLQALAPDASEHTEVVRNHFTLQRQDAPVSQLWAYRKYRGGRSHRPAARP
jgi:hypothetical protein